LKISIEEKIAVINDESYPNTDWLPNEASWQI
jgi:hypothetical protein